MTTRESEIRSITRLALPVVFTQLGVVGMQIVDMVMIGGVLGPGALSQVVAGSTWAFGVLIVGIGVVMGIDPIVAQAHGAGKGDRAGLALQQGVVLAVAAGAVVSVAWWFAEPVLLAAGQDPEVAAGGADYCRAQAFSTVPFLIFMTMRHYLQGRTLVRPALLVIVLANLANVFFNWVFIYGHLGVPSLGVAGAGIATGLTRVFMMLALLGMIVTAGLHREAWVPWSRASFELRGLGAVLSNGIPVALHIGLEIWAFNFTTLWAGQLGAVDDTSHGIAAHGIVLKMCAFTFMMPLGISVAASTRVGNLVGAGDLDGAQRSAWTSIGLGGFVMMCASAAFLLFREQLPAIFIDVDDLSGPAVIALAAGILPIAAAFQVSDGLQVVACGVLRGMGTTRPAAVINFVGYYLLMLPLTAWLAFDWGLGLGLRGIWWGLTAGLVSVAVLFVAWIAVRGPSKAARRM